MEKLKSRAWMVVSPTVMIPTKEGFVTAGPGDIIVEFENDEAVKVDRNVFVIEKESFKNEH